MYAKVKPRYMLASANFNRLHNCRYIIKWRLKIALVLICAYIPIGGVRGRGWRT